LSISALSLPFIAVPIVCASVLQASGSYRRMVANQVLAGAVPVVVILPFAWLYGLQGWVIGRFVAAVVFCLATFYCLKGLFLFSWPSRQSALELIGFSRFQLISGLLSLFLMSADIIMLERITRNLVIVAEYGLASMFVKLLFFIPAAVGRAYFKEIAESESHHRLMSIVKRFTGTSCSGVLALYLLMVAVCHMGVNVGLLNKYRGSFHLLIWLGPTAIFGTFWQIASVVNVCQKRPKIAMYMSLVAASCMLGGGYVLTESLGAVGMAIALSLAYLCGLMAGLWLWSKLRL